jgi:hypothetical protein
VSRAVSFAVFAVLLAGSIALSERDFEFLLEPDFNPALILSFEKFLTTWSSADLPVPGPHVYLDGQYFIYGAAVALLRSLVSLPSDISYTLAAAFGVDAIAYAIGCWFFWRTVLAVTDRMWLAVLATVALFLSPPMLAISLIRVDYLIFGPLLAVIYYSVLFALGKARLRQAIWLGLSIGLLAGFKITGIMYAAIPACALFAHWKIGKNELRYVGISALCAAVLLAVFFVRYFERLPLTDIPTTLISAVAQLSEWARYAPGAWYYYFTDLFYGHGSIFVVGYLAAWAMTSAAAILWRRPFDIFVALNLFWLGAFSLVAMKYQRGGYHLLPFYILAMVAVSCWGPTLRFAVATLLAITIIPSSVAYVGLVREQGDKLVGIDKTKREPLRWVSEHALPDTTVCIMRHSDWTVPPIDRLGMLWTYSPFDFPYLYPEQLAHYAPPNIADLSRQCPVIIFSDFHYDLHLGGIRRASPRQADAWVSFFVELKKRYPPTVFATDKVVGGVSRVEIYDLRPGGRTEPENDGRR